MSAPIDRGLADQLIRIAAGGAQAGLEQFAHLVLDEAKRNIGVVDPAEDPDPNTALAESGRVERHGDGFIVSFNTPYAAKQHEDLRLKHPRGGTPKYLERAATTLAPYLEKTVASAVYARSAKGLTPGRKA